MNNLGNISSYIYNDLPILKLEDNLQYCFEQIEKSSYNALPVSSIGILLQDDIQGLISESEPLSNHQYLIKACQISPKANWMQCFKAIIDNAAQILPVISNDGLFLGYYDSIELVSLLNDLPCFYYEGQELIISHKNNQFSLGKVGQIIEGQGDDFLQFNLISRTDTHSVGYIKIKSNDLNSLLQILRAHGYHIISKHRDDQYIDDLKERSAYLSKFLDI